MGIAFTRNNNFCFDPKAGKALHNNFNVTSRLASRFSSPLTLHSYQGFSSRTGRPILCLTPDGYIGTTSTDSTVAAVNSTELIDEHLVRDGILHFHNPNRVSSHCIWSYRDLSTNILCRLFIIRLSSASKRPSSFRINSVILYALFGTGVHTMRVI